MKRYRASIVFEWSEKKIRKILEIGEAYPSDNEIENLMDAEMHELVEDPLAYDIRFEVIEDKKIK